MDDDPMYEVPLSRLQQLTDEGRATAGVLAKVRDLHRPHWFDPYVKSGQVWLVCRGCDEGAHSESPPRWPCSTADLVYSEQEIADREPHVPECPEDHRKFGQGPPVRAQAVFVRPRELGHDDRLVFGSLQARRWSCDHVAPVPVESADPWD